MKIPKYILSDTNPIHKKFAQEKFPEIFSKCKKAFLSTEIKMRKSEEKAFRYLINELKIEPEEILFIDNKEEFTKKAEELGIKAIQYSNPSNLRMQLKFYDVI